jgi:hypothetical protein
MKMNAMFVSVLVLLSVAATVRGSGGSSTHHGPEPTSAVLFLFAALAFGAIFRRAFAGLFLPYTAVLLVRDVHLLSKNVH